MFEKVNGLNAKPNEQTSKRANEQNTDILRLHKIPTKWPNGQPLICLSKDILQGLLLKVFGQSIKMFLPKMAFAIILIK